MKNFLPILALIFITLKLIDKIHWSWVAVLSPLWGPMVIVAFVSTGMALTHLFKSGGRW